MATWADLIGGDLTAEGNAQSLHPRHNRRTRNVLNATTATTTTSTSTSTSAPITTNTISTTGATTTNAPSSTANPSFSASVNASFNTNYNNVNSNNTSSLATSAGTSNPSITYVPDFPSSVGPNGFNFNNYLYRPCDRPVSNPQNAFRHECPHLPTQPFPLQPISANTNSFATAGNTFTGSFNAAPATTSASSLSFHTGFPLYNPSLGFTPFVATLGYQSQQPCTPSSGQFNPAQFNPGQFNPGQFSSDLVTASTTASGTATTDNSLHNLYDLARVNTLPVSTNTWTNTQNAYLPNLTLSQRTNTSQPLMSNATPRSITPIPQARNLPRVFDPARGFDDDFLASLASQDFSSPSLPPLSSPRLPSTLTLPSIGQLSAVGNQTWTADRVGGVGLPKNEANRGIATPEVGSPQPVGTMPATTRSRTAATGAVTPSRKRRASSTLAPSSRTKSRRKRTPVGSDLPPPLDDDDASNPPGCADPEKVDLSNATEVPAELMAPKVDNRVKIGKFQCVICMDDTTSLTVTHCGHLFCSECLHSSLHIDSIKRACPVCRTKIDLKDKKGKTVKSFYHLELKVMTATKKGKRPADA